MTMTDQHPSTSNGFCACGCGASVKPGQRWREPACKARAYRVRQQAGQKELRQKLWDKVDQYLQIEGELYDLADELEEVKKAYTQLEQAYHTFRAQHRDGQPRQWRASIDLALYHQLAQKYHPDRHAGQRFSGAEVLADLHALVQSIRHRS